MQYCKICLTPNTRPNVKIGSDGICNACKGHLKKKSHINWVEREKKFKEIVIEAKKSSQGYDCIVPVSGGKDSWYQIIKCKEYGLNVLGVTWKTPARTKIGQDNIESMLKNLNIDHIDYSISHLTEKKFMVKAYEKLGDPGISFHMGVYTIPYRIAVQMKIPLIIWGENPQLEYGGNSQEQLKAVVDDKWMKKHGCMQGTDAKFWAEGDLTLKELSGYSLPKSSEIRSLKNNIHRLFLGSFFHWNSFENAKIAKDHGFKYSMKHRKTGFWEFADIDCNFVSLHHFPMWYKFGTTRVLDNLSVQIRYGIISRNEAIEKASKLGLQVPEKDIATFCNYVGKDEKWFWEVLESFRNKDIWKFENKKWSIPNFIIKEWRW